jgi:hypothetical protein
MHYDKTIVDSILWQGKEKVMASFKVNLNSSAQLSEPMSKQAPRG